MDDSGEAVPERFHDPINRIVQRIVAEDYDGLSRDFAPPDATDQHDLGHWVRRYPARFVPLPAEAWEYSSARKIGVRQWVVDVTLWTSEEGPSDMTLQLLIKEEAEGMQIEIVDLHVL